MALTLGINLRALPTSCDNQRLDKFCQLLDFLPGALLQQLRLVVVEGDVIRQLDEVQQFLAVEHRQALAGIEHEWNPCFAELAGVLQHPFPAIRRNDAQADVLHIADMVVMRKIHGAGVKSGDLIVGQIGGDECLRREGFWHAAHMLLRQAELLQPLRIRREIVAHGRHDLRLAADHLQVVGDVAGAAAVLTPHVRHQEGHVENVDLLGQNVVLEVVVKHHDGVVGERAANQCAHGV